MNKSSMSSATFSKDTLLLFCHHVKVPTKSLNHKWLQRNSIVYALIPRPNPLSMIRKAQLRLAALPENTRISNQLQSTPSASVMSRPIR